MLLRVQKRINASRKKWQKKQAEREREEREKWRGREGEEIAAVASCNAFNLYARSGKPSKYNNKIKNGKEKE